MPRRASENGRFRSKTACSSCGTDPRVVPPCVCLSQPVGLGVVTLEHWCGQCSSWLYPEDLPTEPFTVTVRR